MSHEAPVGILLVTPLYFGASIQVSQVFHVVLDECIGLIVLDECIGLNVLDEQRRINTNASLFRCDWF
jgi:hypothetical protein